MDLLTRIEIAVIVWVVWQMVTLLSFALDAQRNEVIRRGALLVGVCVLVGGTDDGWIGMAWVSACVLIATVTSMWEA